ncbi:hypothetical protein [Methanococcus voltae]|uniref:Uncharacterized protein n=1 Tax=Methanococcus voltae (strain ATCC BAA-1334 / A3) TaxID=456320 RepID=D7DS71_METV3|nr:hypothetical protein [Methanococcus voltae]MCS3901507.1 hypothetical protein [Methanococcus voltae]
MEAISEYKTVNVQNLENELKKIEKDYNICMFHVKHDLTRRLKEHIYSELLADNYKIKVDTETERSLMNMNSYEEMEKIFIKKYPNPKELKISQLMRSLSYSNIIWDLRRKKERNEMSNDDIKNFIVDMNKKGVLLSGGRIENDTYYMIWELDKLTELLNLEFNFNIEYQKPFNKDVEELKETISEAYKEVGEIRIFKNGKIILKPKDKRVKDRLNDLYAETVLKIL